MNWRGGALHSFVGWVAKFPCFGARNPETLRFDQAPRRLAPGAFAGPAGNIGCEARRFTAGATTFGFVPANPRRASPAAFNTGGRPEQNCSQVPRGFVGGGTIRYDWPERCLRVRTLEGRYGLLKPNSQDPKTSPVVGVPRRRSAIPWHGCHASSSRKFGFATFPRSAFRYGGRPPLPSSTAHRRPGPWATAKSAHQLHTTVAEQRFRRALFAKTWWFASAHRTLTSRRWTAGAWRAIRDVGNCLSAEYLPL